MVKNHISERFEYRSLHILMSPRRVPLHYLPFPFIQRSPFVENTVLDEELANIMEHPCHVCLCRGESEVIVCADHNVPCYLGGKYRMLVEMEVAGMKALLYQDQ